MNASNIMEYNQHHPVTTNVYAQVTCPGKNKVLTNYFSRTN